MATVYAKTATDSIVKAASSNAEGAGAGAELRLFFWENQSYHLCDSEFRRGRDSRVNPAGVFEQARCAQGLRR
jgi:hypothetical protein